MPVNGCVHILGVVHIFSGFLEPYRTYTHWHRAYRFAERGPIKRKLAKLLTLLTRI